MQEVDSTEGRVQKLENTLVFLNQRIDNQIDSLVSKVERNQELLIEVSQSESAFSLEVWIGLIVNILGAIFGAWVGIILATRKERKEKRRIENKISKVWDPYVGQSFKGRKKNPMHNELGLDIVEFKLVERYHDQLVIEGKNLIAHGVIGPMRGSISLRPPEYEFGEGFYNHDDTDERRRFGVIKVFLRNGRIVSQSEFVKPNDVLGHEAFVWHHHPSESLAEDYDVQTN
jgi:hypothetical protein